MAYRITYPGKRRTRSGFPFWGILLAGGVLVLLRRKLGRFLLPGDPEITATALTTLVEQLRQGSGAGEAVSTFCRTIVQGAGIG